MTELNPHSNPIVRVCGLQHRYRIANGERAVLNDISFELNSGETVALLGQSGSGKSTLLNLISGLEPVQHGEIELFGSALKGMTDRARTLMRRDLIGFVYQAFNLIPTLTVGENITLPLSLNNMPPQLQQQQLEKTLVSIGLENRSDDYPDKLSGGEQQRVAVARAIIHTPPLLLADEPTGNLDAQTGRQVLRLIRNLVSEKGCALLLVTHSDEVASHADRRLVIEDGVLLHDAPGHSDNAW